MTSYISYLTSIKELYKLNNNELDALYNNLNIEQNNNLTLDNLTKCKNYINQLLKQQTILKNKIPQDKYNNINSFLINVVNNNNIIEEKINNVNRNSNSNSNRNSNINIDRIFDMKSINDFSIQNKNLNENFNSNINRENFNKNTKLKTEYNNTLEKENINPYKLYGFKKNEKFTLDELKSKYKKYAIQTHPDKNNGETRNFKIIKEAYDKLYEEYMIKQNDLQFNDLKNNSQDFIYKQEKTPRTNLNINKNDFNVNKFNSVFSENKIQDVNEEGYESWIKSNSFDDENIKKNNKLNGGFSINNFNDVFNSDVKLSNDIVKYTKPKELFMNSDNNCLQLGEKIENFTGETKNMKFTDYREAHTTTKLVDNNSNYKTYKNINELEASRSNIIPLNESEIEEFHKEEHNNKIKEDQRNQNMRLFDEAHFRNYNKVNKLMLG